MSKPKQEPALYIYVDKSVLVDEEGVMYRFDEGQPSIEAKTRLVILRERLEAGFLDDIIIECRSPKVRIENLTEEQTVIIESLVNSITSEVGRAIVGLTILQLTIKSILPEQSIRLHKSSNHADFSWREGLPMRVLDKNYITPVLRKYHLLRLNADGFMMTRSLAENYPYSKLYKAAIRGAKKEWLEIIDAVERNQMNSLDALRQLIIFLNNKSESFAQLTNLTFLLLSSFLEENPSFDECLSVAKNFIENSTYSARIFEIVIHALFQVIEEEKRLGGFLKPLSQMRSANKKHGNIGDIEITMTQGNMDILEAWDAKYGKTYLRDELEELNEKLISHPQIEIAGFVTNQEPNLKSEIRTRIDELEVIHGTEIRIMQFEEWVHFQIEKYELQSVAIGSKWITAIAESICLRRRAIAPIDEPTTDWVQSFNECIR